MLFIFWRSILNCLPRVCLRAYTIWILRHIGKCYSLCYSLRSSQRSFSPNLSIQLRSNPYFVWRGHVLRIMYGFVLRFSSDFTWIQHTWTLFNSLVRNIRNCDFIDRKFYRLLFFNKNILSVWITSNISWCLFFSTPLANREHLRSFLSGWLAGAPWERKKLEVAAV